MMGQSFILTVDHNPRNLELLSQFLDQAGYQTMLAASMEEFDQAMARGEEIELALVDIAGFDSRIWRCCEKLRDRNIPLLIISPRQSAAIQETSIAHGAQSVLIKPLAVKELLGIMRSLLEN
jgi:DNA-binding response OmpR family regulator